VPFEGAQADFIAFPETLDANKFPSRKKTRQLNLEAEIVYLLLIKSTFRAAINDLHKTRILSPSYSRISFAFFYRRRLQLISRNNKNEIMATFFR